MEQILAAAKEPQRSMLTILAETGMRVGELKWLTWDDVDFDHGVILHPGEGRLEAEDRRRAGDPDDPGGPGRVGTLAAQDPVGLHRRGVRRKYPRGDHQISERRLLEYLKRVLKELGLDGHLHTFRHSFISHALTQGIPEAIVRQWVGHVDPEVIKHYTHILDEASQAAMRRLAEANTPQPAARARRFPHD